MLPCSSIKLSHTGLMFEFYFRSRSWNGGEKRQIVFTFYLLHLCIKQKSAHTFPFPCAQNGLLPTSQPWNKTSAYIKNCQSVPEDLSTTVTKMHQNHNLLQHLQMTWSVVSKDDCQSQAYPNTLLEFQYFDSGRTFLFKNKLQLKLQAPHWPS